MKALYWDYSVYCSNSYQNYFNQVPVDYLCTLQLIFDKNSYSTLKLFSRFGLFVGVEMRSKFCPYWTWLYLDYSASCSTAIIIILIENLEISFAPQKIVFCHKLLLNNGLKSIV